ncbi:Astacin (Peptidase family M12A) [Popillia japonica]|uniref:Metalloendopeptidase n=1 Tax=Popillia japonica TaxID=7064 RepID=A0AAW1MZW3_POPJA
MDQYHKHTCIRFRRKNVNDADYIRIKNSKTGCWSSVGRLGGEQDLNLQSPGCLSTLGTPVHELMHALGFHHEQTRSERDEYVTILWENISSGHEGNFVKSENGTTTGFGVEYDYGSVMHYSKYAFSKNKKPTIEPTKPDAKIGQREGFSKGDIIKLNEMYNCSSIDPESITTELPIYTTPATTIIDSISDIVNMIIG